MEKNRPVVPPLYDRPGNLQRKMDLVARCIADLKHTRDYYGGIFVNDPWFTQRIREAEASYADLERRFQEELVGLAPPAAFGEE